MLKFVLFIVVISAILVGCGYATHNDPVTVLSGSDVKAHGDALVYAIQHHGSVDGPNTCCNSMLPLIKAGDYLVVVKTPYSDSLLGRVVIYSPVWNHGHSVAHRLVAKDKDGFIASGDNNKYSESEWRVTPENYVGEVIAIYRP